jgi:hypothetical protein
MKKRKADRAEGRPARAAQCRVTIQSIEVTYEGDAEAFAEACGAAFELAFAPLRAVLGAVGTPEPRRLDDATRS